MFIVHHLLHIGLAMNGRWLRSRVFVFINEIQTTQMTASVSTDRILMMKEFVSVRRLEALIKS